MRVVLRIPKRQVRIAAAAAVLVGLGAGAGVTAQTEPEPLGAAHPAGRTLSVPQDRTIDLGQHPEERLQRLPSSSTQPEAVAAAPMIGVAPTRAPQQSGTAGGQRGEQPPQGGQAGQQEPPAGAQQAPPPTTSGSLLSADERAALALVEQIIRDQEGVIMGTGFDYASAGRRDPFLSLLRVVEVGRTEGPRPPGVPGFLISEVELKGIASSGGRWHAMIVGTNQRAYFIEVGTQLWDGHVVDIRSGEVLFQQEFEDALGARRTREVIKELRKTDGGGQTP